ncbi:unnamed protein product [Urochloa decumbens]|uniref:F-box domain-containing protein n=1 Tax=Urochloa decumbens TaxID=240449 RepID=A0ABC9C5K8_9POAL
MGARWDGIPADVFMDILQRVPASPRRRLRVVCRHWRDVIDDRTRRRRRRHHARAKVLAFADDGLRLPRAYVLDDLTGKDAAGGKDLKLHGGVVDWDATMVGSCNGLICLHRYRGDAVVVNPSTGGKLAVPPPSKAPGETDASSYSFAYHPATALYKIVHVPCRGGAGAAFDAVSVFTLGDTSWREVPVPAGTSCHLSFGLVSVGGATYWVAADAHSLMSLDLKDERVAFVTKLPVRVGLWLDLSWHLTTDINGRVGLAVCSYEMKRTRTLKGCQTKVWMLEGGGKNKKTWALRYRIVEPGRDKPFHQIAWPHAVHGEHLLTTRNKREYELVSLHASPMSEVRAHCGVVRTDECAPPPSVGLYDNCRSVRTFAHVETREPLALYRCNDDDEDEVDDDVVEWTWKFDGEQGRWKLMLHCSLMDLTRAVRSEWW